MQLDGGDAGHRQLLRELLGGVLGAHEEHGAVLAAGEAADDVELVGCGHLEDVVLHGADRRDGRVDRVRGGVGEVALHEDVDAVVERGGEEHPLALARGLVEQPLHGRQEAEVGHVVGLVEDRDLDAGQVGAALLDEVLEPAGAGDEDVDAGTERVDLRVLTDSAEDDGGREVGGLGQRLDDGQHLVGELAGRDQDEGAGLLGAAGAASEPGDEREGEGEGLAGAGAAAAEDVLAGERVGQRGRLDRERRGEALAGELGAQRGGHTEIGERGGAHGEVVPQSWRGPSGSCHRRDRTRRITRGRDHCRRHA